MGGVAGRRAAWAVALAAGALHYWEVASYHHGLNNLSVPEQKVAGLKTENAFYYSYFEETVAAPSVSAALHRAVRDHRSEAPSTINAIHRFNIYQELLCGLLYRLLHWAFAGHWLPDPWYFFRHCSYFLQALGHVALVRLAARCGGDGLLGGALPGVSLFLMLFLHRTDISRIHDVGMLNLRENWTMPVILFQVFTLHGLLTTHPGLAVDRKARSWQAWLWAFRLSTVVCLLFWQFSAFAFLLQVSAMFLCTLLSCSNGAREVLSDVVVSHVLAAVSAAVLLFGNELLVHHMLLTQCVAILAVLKCRRSAPTWRLLFWVDGALAVLLFALLRLLQSRWATAEEHIGEIFSAKIRQLFPDLLSKQTHEPTFNARLYLAVSVFDFIDWHTVKSGLPTGVYHFGAAGALLWAFALARRVLLQGTKTVVAVAEARDGSAKTKPSGRQPKEGGGSPSEPLGAMQAEAFGYGVLLAQLAFFLILGCFINRLKVLGAPFLCLLAAVAAAPRPLEIVLGFVGGSGITGAGSSGGRATGWRLVFASAAVLQLGQLAWIASKLPFLSPGSEMLKDMVWSDGDRGELYDWMIRHLPANSTVVASMPLSAELRLNTPFRLVIHPQFEDLALRDRVQELYQFYQCTPPGRLVPSMRKFASDIILLEYRRCDFSPFILDWYPEFNCVKGQKPWKDLFCPAAHVSPHFELLFANAGFAVLRLRSDAEVERASKAPQLAIEDIRAWQPMLDNCLREDAEACVSRIAELATVFHSKIGQPKVSRTLFNWVREHAGRDGRAQYILGRHLDYDLGRPGEAAAPYRKAAELVPNNPLIIREYLMWLDVEAKDNRTLEWLMRPRRYTKGDRLSLLDLGDVTLACEASVPAFELFRDLDWAEDLWQLATREGMGSSCVKNNWPLHNQGRSFNQDLGRWGAFSHIFFWRSLRSEYASTVSSGVRYQPPRRPLQIGLAASFDEES